MSFNKGYAFGPVSASRFLQDQAAMRKAPRNTYFLALRSNSGAATDLKEPLGERDSSVRSANATASTPG